jgi:hypothetical protein
MEVFQLPFTCSRLARAEIDTGRKKIFCFCISSSRFQYSDGIIPVLSRRSTRRCPSRISVTSTRRDPRETPAHALFVGVLALSRAQADFAGGKTLLMRSDFRSFNRVFFHDRFFFGLDTD